METMKDEDAAPRVRDVTDAASRDDDLWLDVALAMAERAGRMGNVPVGAVVVIAGREVARSGNLRETLHDPTAHAEILALREAARVARSWRLDEATVYVTLEPCAMCAGALVQARVRRVVYAAREPKTGAHVSRSNGFEGSGVCVEEHSGAASASVQLLSAFFAERR